EDLADRADHERLGEAGHADQEAVAAREDGGEDLVDDLGLADDGPAQLVEHLRANLTEVGQDFVDAIGGHRGSVLPCGQGERELVLPIIVAKTEKIHECTRISTNECNCSYSCSFVSIRGSYSVTTA